MASFLAEIFLDAEAERNRRGTSVAERRLFVSDLVAASPQEEAPRRWAPFDHGAALIAFRTARPTGLLVEEIVPVRTIIGEPACEGHTERAPSARQQ